MRGFLGTVTTGGCGEAPAPGAPAPPMTVGGRAAFAADAAPRRRWLGGGGGSESGTTSSPVNSGNSGSVHSRVSKALAPSSEVLPCPTPSLLASIRLQSMFGPEQEVGAVRDLVPTFFDADGSVWPLAVFRYLRVMRITSGSSCPRRSSATRNMRST